MFGSSLMICPVYVYKARTREVYFPENAGWYNLYDGKFNEGGRKESVSAPYDRMPVFVPAGSILPIGKLIQNTTKPQTDLTIFVYAGKNGTFTLYEDENVNYNYEKGSFSTIQFSYNNTDKTLSISNRKGNFTGMVNERNFHFVLIAPNKPVGIDTTLKDLKSIHYTGEKTSIILE